MAQDAKVIVLRGDRVTVETIVSFVAGHAEGIGAADPVRRLAPPWPAAQRRVDGLGVRNLIST